MAEPQKRPPLVLIASQGEWIGRSVESVLELNGYMVLRVETGRRALDMARRTMPDALILDESLSDLSGSEVCAALRADPLFDPATPIVITAPAPAAHRVRIAAYEAGAWDFCSQPLDVETLVLKLGTFVRARRYLETSQATSLIDPLTGVYSSYGLQQWAEQLGARANRKHEAFTCVVVTAASPNDANPNDKPTSAALTDMADLCRAQARKSDVIAYVGDSKFAILAPDTDGSGARQFVGRLQRAFQSTPGAVESRSPRISAGFCAISDFGAAGMDAAEVVRRAETAMDHAYITSFGEAVSFDDLPVS